MLLNAAVEYNVANFAIHSSILKFSDENVEMDVGTEL